MNTFLQRQYVKNTGRRKKLVRRILIRVQQISLVVLVWLLFVGCIYGLYHLVFERGIFVIKNVSVEGQLLHVSESEIRDAAGIRVGTNLFSADLARVQRQISENPWVREIAVARKLPSTIWIYIGEYTPFAMVATDDLYMADGDGNVFKKVDGNDEKNFPVLTGLSKNEDLNDAMEVLKTYMGSPIADYFAPAEINFNKARGYSIVLSGCGTVVRLGFGDVAAKLDRLYLMLGAISSYKAKMRYVDLNIPGKVVVKYES